MSGRTADEIRGWFDGLTGREKLDLLQKLEPKEVGGIGGGPIVVSWQD